jgi:hypothetical protein
VKSKLLRYSKRRLEGIRVNIETQCSPLGTNQGYLQQDATALTTHAACAEREETSKLQQKLKQQQTTMMMKKIWILFMQMRMQNTRLS